MTNQDEPSPIDDLRNQVAERLGLTPEQSDRVFAVMQSRPDLRKLNIAAVKASRRGDEKRAMKLARRVSREWYKLLLPICPEAAKQFEAALNSETN